MSMLDTTDADPIATTTWAPCIACGIGVHNPDPESIETVTTFGAVSGVEVQMGRCSTCWLIRTAAVDLMTAHPSERLRIGSPAIAYHRLELALNALDALGVADPAKIDRLTDGAAAIRTLIDHMAAVGGVARFATRYLAAMSRGDRPDSAAPARWEGINDGQRHALQQAYAELYHERFERPAPILAPSETGRPSGCMLCGVASWEALPSRAQYIWTEMSADAVTLGGQHRAEDIDGVLCPRCDHAVDRAEGIGMTAMGLSVLDFLRASPMNDFATARGIDGLTGWAVLRGATPNREPWAHVDLDGLRSTLHASL